MWILKALLPESVLNRIRKFLQSKNIEYDETNNWFIVKVPRHTKRERYAWIEDLKEDLRKEGIDVPVGIGRKAYEAYIPKNVKDWVKAKVTVDFKPSKGVELVFCVSDSTYPLRDKFKEAGYKWNGVWAEWCKNITLLSSDELYKTMHKGDLSRIKNEISKKAEAIASRLYDELEGIVAEKNIRILTPEKEIVDSARYDAVSTSQILISSLHRGVNVLRRILPEEEYKELEELLGRDLIVDAPKKTLFIIPIRWMEYDEFRRLNEMLKRYGFKYNSAYRRWERSIE